jgi:transposase
MARITGPRKVYRYTNDFKLKAVKLTEIGSIQVKQVAAALEIHPWMLTRWRKDKREGLLKGRADVAIDKRKLRDIEEVAKLKLELALLKEEHELLKKAIWFCSVRRMKSSASSKKNRTVLA